MKDIKNSIYVKVTALCKLSFFFYLLSLQSKQESNQLLTYTLQMWIVIIKFLVKPLPELLLKPVYVIVILW